MATPDRRYPPYTKQVDPHRKNKAPLFARLLLLLHHSGVKLELLALKQVPIRAPALPRTGREASQKPPRLEQIRDSLIKLQTIVRALLLLLRSPLRKNLTLTLTGLLLSNINPIMPMVILTEGGGINLDDASLDERVGTNELVVGGVVHDI